MTVTVTVTVMVIMMVSMSTPTPAASAEQGCLGWEVVYPHNTVSCDCVML